MPLTKEQLDCQPKGGKWTRVTDFRPRRVLPSTVGGKEASLESLFLLEDGTGVSPDNPIMKTRCTFCDDRLCIERGGIRQTFYLDGKTEKSIVKIIDCIRRVDLQQFLDGKKTLKEALERDR